jgi:two-component system, OmpR family, sensor kinase
MNWHSFRTRLSLWNAVVLALILGGFGLVIYTSTRKQVMATFDHELAVRAQRFAFGPLRMPPDLYQNHLSPLPERSVAGSTSGDEVWAQREREHERLASLLDGDARRLAAVRRPRLLDRNGKSIGPFQDGPWNVRAFREALAGQANYCTIRLGQEHLRVYSIPRRMSGQTASKTDGEIIGVAQVAGELGAVERNASSQLNTLLLLLPFSLLVAAFGGLFLAERALRPIRAVTHAATQISDQDLSRRLTVQGEDEMAELACTFNAMISRLESAFQSRERAYSQLTAAYEQQRRFTADASHELRTPLSRIKISASMALAREQTPQDYRRALEVTDQAADAMERLIQQLLLLARADAGQLPFQTMPLDLAGLLCEVGAVFAEQEGAPILLDLPKQAVTICGDRDHLQRVFSNLLENARRHTPATGRIMIAIALTPGQALVLVTDTGEGIPPEHLPHVMERFYRVDAARTRRGAGGTGLGLAIARSIVAAHGGTLTLESQVGEGTVATVALPVANALFATVTTQNNRQSAPENREPVDTNVRSARLA